MKTSILTLSPLLALPLALTAQWVPVGDGMDSYVHGSAVCNGGLYACGNFEHADGEECLGIATWDGNAWGPVGGGFMHNALSNVVYALTVFDGELIAGGYVDPVAGMPIKKVARWNGSAWSPMGTDCLINTPRGFAVHNGELYMCGQGSGALYPASVQKWNGAGWVSLESGSNSEVWSLASYNGELYACGNFTSFGGATVNGVARWNGGAWIDVAGGIPGMGFTHMIRSLAVFDGKLYAGGTFTNIGTATVSNLAAWDGTTWSDVGTGVGGSTASVQSLLPFGERLFVGGSFWTVGGNTANRSATWDGSAWTIYGTDLGAGARTQEIHNGELYSFGEGNFNGQNYAAKWTEDTFSSIPEFAGPRTLTVAPNPAEQGAVVDLQEDGTNSTAAQVILRSSDARIVRSEQVVKTDHLRIQLSDIAVGAYLVELRDAQGGLITHGRLIVK